MGSGYGWRDSIEGSVVAGQVPSSKKYQTAYTPLPGAAARLVNAKATRSPLKWKILHWALLTQLKAWAATVHKANIANNVLTVPLWSLPTENGLACAAI